MLFTDFYIGLFSLGISYLRLPTSEAKHKGQKWFVCVKIPDLGRGVESKLAIAGSTVGHQFILLKANIVLVLAAAQAVLTIKGSSIQLD